jgi:hemolysin activation/secretion protein
VIERGGDAELDLTASLEYRRSKDFLLGQGFSFSPDGERGVTELAVLQLGQELTLRSPRSVFAARSALRWGLDALGATTGSTEPDGQFLSWLVQAQWARRLPRWGATLLLRGDLQLSTDPLPGIEQFGIGGASTVRGYRENRLVRDNGWVGSLELRVPLWRRPNAEPLFELVPFFDVGRSWNRGRATPGVATLSSAGVGLLFRIRANLYGQIYYAHGFRDLPDAASRRALQDRGVHFRIGSVFQ